MHAMLTDLMMKATVVLAVGCAAAFALRRAPAAVRHLLWTLVALALLALPALDLAVPAWPVRSLPLVPSITFTTQSAMQAGTNSAALPPRAAPAARRGAAPIPTHTRPLDWLLIIWSAGVAISLGRLLAGLMVTHRLRHDAEPFATVEGVSILRSPSFSMPITLGIFHPAILLPSDAAAWTEERRRIVIAHELAHIRRRDCLVHILAHLAFSLYWFHPLVWWASRQLVREREHASDDLVLATGVRASDYAALLLDVARSFQPAGVVATAGIAIARRSELEGRMLAILDSNLRRGAVSRAGTLAACACALVLVLPLAAMRPAAPQNAAFRASTGDTAPVQLSDDLLKSTDYKHLDEVAQKEMNVRLRANAQRLYERSLELRQQKFGEQSPEFAAGLIHLAGVYRVSPGKYQQAIALYQRALPIQEATLGPNHPDVAATLYYLARDLAAKLHLARGDSDPMSLYQRALDIRTKAFGPSDARVAEVLVAMAQLTNDEPLYQRALSTADAAGPSSSLTATALEAYAAWLTGHNRAAESVPLINRAGQIRTLRVQEIGATHGPAPGLTSKAAKVSPGMTPPKLAYKIEPEYSEQARSEKVQGTVILYVEVGTDGLVHNTQLKKGVGSGLDEKAAQAVNLWRFTPAMKDGQPTTVAATIEVNFRLL